MEPNRSSGIFYGWYIVAAAFVANFISLGTSFYMLNGFMEPLCDIRGWTRTQLNVALVIGTLCSLGSQFFYGTIVAQTGPRILMTIGPLVAGFAYVCMGYATSLASLYVLFFVLFAGNAAYGALISNTVVNNWFVLHRGKAIGLSTAGGSLAGAVLPFLSMILVLRTGLSTAFASIGILITGMAPLAWLIIRDWPEQYGLRPDGIGTGALPPAPVRVPGNPWPLTRLLRTGAFWHLCVGFTLVMGSVNGVMSQLKPRFSDIGFDHMTGMTLVAATALSAAVGKYIWGTLCDRFDPRRVTAALYAVNAAGLGLALVEGSPVSLALFIILFGFSMGGVWSAGPILVAHIFGRRNFPSVYRFITIFLMFQVAGYLAAGISFDLTGAYDTAYMLFICADLLGALLILTMTPPRLDDQDPF